MRKYYSVLTEAGVNAFSAAAVIGVPVGFAAMAVGDGNGQQIQPDGSMTGLVNERYRGPLNNLVIVDPEKNIIRAEMVIPPQTGGFWIREAALYNDEGVCLAVANVADAYKPLLAEGSGRNQSIRVWIAVSDTASVELKSDNAAILASQEDLLRVKNDTKDYSDEQVSALEKVVIRNKKAADDAEASLSDSINRLKVYTDEQNETLDTTLRDVIAETVSSAIREAWEDDNPKGTVRFFSANVNPNTRWPWSRWVYTGENKSIRIASADGSDVGTTGGSDNVTLQQGNLPAVQINVTGETSEQGQQELTTSGNGRHRHRAGDGAPGDTWQEASHGTDNQKYTGWNYTDYAEDHQHDVTIPAHKHTTSGKTANLGEGKSFSVVEAHTLLMCWSRVA
ncbi:TPA: phage tail protein [Klebsiella pneumoniae]|uniref:phage tail protein n=1 Tax=Klebsiella pneumoniae TaxID=573 RepID=UPI000DEA6168|nr:phage tail protein [Klebsiella pneumoniae]ELA0336264.1 phage tail protein [Klebsiella pneumoniae]MBD7554299.1 phage tail protein [Klebsiella pneumoniae]MBD7820711.1 phage tail protein [Klebsiella pneumoniae]RCH15663.1 phage tail-collar fiber family protein [Klebsiella pneumoniae]RRE76543.1 phage tail protein [Klebsiella pneumoniae]